MGTDKNIKLHIVTDIKTYYCCRLNKLMDSPLNPHCMEKQIYEVTMVTL